VAITSVLSKIGLDKCEIAEMVMKFCLKNLAKPLGTFTHFVFLYSFLVLQYFLTHISYTPNKVETKIQ